MAQNNLHKPKLVKKPNIIRPPSVVGQAARFALLPNLGASLVGVKDSLSVLVNLIAQIFAITNLIEKSHPCLSLKNASQYKASDIVKIAFNNLKWDKAHIPQIIIFFSVLAFLLFIVLSIMTLILSVGIDAAHAQPQLPNKDAAEDILAGIFATTPGSSLPTAFGGMLAVYSKTMLILAGVILIYIVISSVLETAESGRPFGKSFNHTWAPIRIVVAIGLLIPLTGGLNSGQYIVLQLARMGSRIATEVLTTFTDYVGMGQGIIVPQTKTEPQKALRDLFNSMACAYKQQIEDATTADPVSQIAARLNQIRSNPNFNGNSIIPIGGTKTLGNQEGCAPLTIAHYSQPQSIDQDIANLQTDFFVQNVTQIAALAHDFVSYEDPQNTSNYFQAIQLGRFKNDMNRIVNTYTTNVNGAMGQRVDMYNDDLARTISADLQARGWVAIPIYFHRLIDANMRVANAVRAFPDAGSADDVSGSFMDGYNTFETQMGNIQDKADNSTATSFTQAVKNKLNPMSFFMRKMNDAMAGIATSAIQLFGKPVFNADNPLIAMVAAGRALFTVGTAAILTWTALAAGVGVFATVGTNAVLALGGFFTIIIMLTLVSGMMLGFLLPLIPMFRFFFGVVGWIILVLIAVIGMPLFALAHLRAGGEGFVGQLQVQSAYTMLIGIVVRPTLIIFGFVLAMILFKPVVQIAGSLFIASLGDNNSSLNNYLPGAFGFGSAITTLFGSVFLIQILSDFMLATANACFKLIDIVPTQAMTWMGAGAIPNPVENAADEVINAARSNMQTLQSAGMKYPEARTQARVMEQLTKDEASLSASSKLGSPSGGQTGGSPPELGGPNGHSGGSAGGRPNGSNSGSSGNNRGDSPKSDGGGNAAQIPSSSGGGSDRTTSSPSNASLPGGYGLSSGGVIAPKSALKDQGSSNNAGSAQQASNSTAPIENANSLASPPDAEPFKPQTNSNAISERLGGSKAAQIAGNALGGAFKAATGIEHTLSSHSKADTLRNARQAASALQSQGSQRTQGVYDPSSAKTLEQQQKDPWSK